MRFTDNVTLLNAETLNKLESDMQNKIQTEIQNATAPATQTTFGTVKMWVSDSTTLNISTK